MEELNHGNMVYEDGLLSYILNPAGRAFPTGQAHEYSYEYFLHDHLGNLRVIFGDPDSDHEAEVIQENHYYPFGMTMAGLDYSAGLENRYLYQGKERTGDFNLWWSDFHARRFDSQLGRWHVPDPAGQFASAYVGMGNNPVIGIDPDGMFVDWIRGFRSRGFELYKYTQFLRRKGYNYNRGVFHAPQLVPIDRNYGTDNLRIEKELKEAQEKLILFEKLGLDAEIIGNRIIINYQFAGDGSEGDIYSKSYGSLSAALKDFGYWLDKDASSGQWSDFFQLFQQEYDQLPDYLTLTPTQKAQYLIQAGARSQDKMVNLHSVFKNYTPFLLNENDGMNVGLQSDLRSAPLSIILNGHYYNIHYNVAVITHSDQSFSSVINMQINNPFPDWNLKFGGGSGTRFNPPPESYDWWIWVQGNRDAANSFYRDYWGH